MTQNGVTNWVLVQYTATSLYSVLAAGNYHETNAGRAEWVSLINTTPLQSKCNKEGFNVKCSVLKFRIGIAGNNEHDCITCDSFIGYGIEGIRKWSSGNVWLGVQELKTFGYIFIQ